MTNISLTETIKKQIPNVFLSANLPKFGEKKSGKVRDLYFHDDKIIIITTDRISAFDAILNQGIPYK
ncbi:MAG: phosphoribosylaminoimidazolesuccinocarboxamide synthase, partial [Candidatus Heimdallarchaeota archaeon]